MLAFLHCCRVRSVELGVATQAATTAAIDQPIAISRVVLSAEDREVKVRAILSSRMISDWEDSFVIHFQTYLHVDAMAIKFPGLSAKLARYASLTVLRIVYFMVAINSLTFYLIMSDQMTVCNTRAISSTSLYVFPSVMFAIPLLLLITHQSFINVWKREIALRSRAQTSAAQTQVRFFDVMNSMVIFRYEPVNVSDEYSSSFTI